MTDSGRDVYSLRGFQRVDSLGEGRHSRKDQLKADSRLMMGVKACRDRRWTGRVRMQFSELQSRVPDNLN